MLLKDSSSSLLSNEVLLDDEKQTTLYIAKYERPKTRIRLKIFKEATHLLSWCNANNILDAMSGGFFASKDAQPLGEMWIDGVKQDTANFDSPWHRTRGSLYTYRDQLLIDARNKLPEHPAGDLIQAGPMLVKSGVPIIYKEDAEGFSKSSNQFDSNITVGRYPRAAIGFNESYIFSVVCDGRSSRDAGMTLSEFAKSLAVIGCDSALNLDGGGSATLIHNGELQNTPRDNAHTSHTGRSVFSAIVFEAM